MIIKQKIKKGDKNELICKTETDTQTLKTNTSKRKIKYFLFEKV